MLKTHCLAKRKIQRAIVHLTCKQFYDAFFLMTLQMINHHNEQRIVFCFSFMAFTGLKNMTISPVFSKFMAAMQAAKIFYYIMYLFQFTL